jgi:hypothetical protein
MEAYGGMKAKSHAFYVYMKASGQFNGPALFPYETAFGRINGQQTN